MNNWKRIKKIVPYQWRHAFTSWRLSLGKGKTYDEIERYVDRKFYAVNKRHIDWDAPQSYMEKISVDKIYNLDPLKTRLTDKLLVQDWIKEKIGEKYLIPIYGVYDRFSDVDINALPERFVIKCNHDAGNVTIVDDKRDLTPKKLRYLQKHYDDYVLKLDFSLFGFEMHYRPIRPKLLIQKHMGSNLNDYKFLCFNGKPYYVWVDADRFIEHRRNIYNMNWELQPFTWAFPNIEGPCEKPACFEEMVQVASKLSEGIPQVRVDLFCVDNRVYFGEMTFTCGNGLELLNPVEWDYKVGALWDFDNSMRRQVRMKKARP